jgi:branched-chain amino acid transport system substrate-binding protein
MIRRATIAVLVAGFFVGAVALGLAWAEPPGSVWAASSGSEEGQWLANSRSLDRNRVQQSHVITIGLVTWKSAGFIAPYGWGQQNSVQLAVSQTNAAGGIMVGGTPYSLTLVVGDDGCNGSLTPGVAQSMLDAGAVAVLGHFCSGVSLVAQGIYSASGTAMVLPSATNGELTYGPYTNTFRTIPMDGANNALLARYLHRLPGVTSSAIVEGPSASSAEVYSSMFTALGGSITSRRQLTSTAQFAGALNAIKAEHPAAIVYLDGDGDRAATFTLAVYQAGITNTLIGWAAASNDTALLDAYSAAASPLAPPVYAALTDRPFAKMPGWSTYLGQYQAAHFLNYGTDPAGTAGVYAYDAARIVAAAIQRAATAGVVDRPHVRDQIAAMRNYGGVIGLYRSFDSHGDAVPQWAWLERYSAGTWQAIPTDPAAYLPLIQRSTAQ